MNQLASLAHRTLRTTGAAVGAALLLTGLAACGGTDTTSSSSADTSSPAASGSASAATGSLSAKDQSGDGTTLTVASVDLKGADHGWISVHADLDGKPGPVVGNAKIPGGASSDVKVTLDKKTATGAFWPMLHVDDQTVGTYEFPKTAGADLPVKDGTNIVMKKVMLTVG